MSSRSWAHQFVGAAVAALAFACTSNAAADRPLTVADAIQTTRAMTASAGFTTVGRVSGQMELVGTQGVFISPNGKRWVAMLITGDLRKNGNWVDIVGGCLDSFDVAKKVENYARLFTAGLGNTDGLPGSSELLAPTYNPPVWFPDSKRIAFFWPDDKGVRQVVSVDVINRKMEFLTHHPADVVEFDLDTDGALLYGANLDYSNLAEELIDEGFVVTNDDVLSVILGHADGHSINEAYYDFERFLIAPGSTTALPIRLPVAMPNKFRMSWSFRPTFSPDHRFIVAEGPPQTFPSDWARYTHDWIRRALRDKDQFSSGVLRKVFQLYVIDRNTGSARPLWNALLAPTIQSHINVAWSPNSRSIAIAPSFLPATESSVDGLAGNAIAIVDAGTGTYRELPRAEGVDPQRIGRVEWTSNLQIQLHGANGTLHRYSLRDRAWTFVGSQSAHVRNGHPIRAELRQDMQTPPAIYVVESITQREAMILDLNPALRSDFTLGQVEAVSWADGAGRSWHGRLYLPVRYRRGRQYPLVIQTHGVASEKEFSLYGTGGFQPGLAPSVSIYAAQPLANREIAVLQMQDKYIEGVSGTPAEPELYVDGFKGAMRYVVERGLADPTRIGIMGHSRMGWKVEYALTHSDLPVRAAIVADNFDGGYIRALVAWDSEIPQLIGAQPFGEGLQVWLRNSPPFNADKVRVPLQIQWSSIGLPGVLGAWEMFTRLRLLGKPVELYLIPDIRHGSHTLQNPRQCYAGQQRAVDWWDFWLNGNEDPAEEKEVQYRSWRAMRAEHTVD